MRTGTGFFVRTTPGIVVIAVLAMSFAPNLVANEEAYREKQAIEAAGNGVSPDVVRRELPIVTEKAGQTPKRPLGAITYDDGVVNVLPWVSSNCWGNRFDSALNPAATAIFPVMNSGSISMVSVYMVSVAGNVYLTIADQLNTGAGTAMNITSASFPMTAGWNIVTFATPVDYAGGNYLVGVWYFGGDVPGLGTGTLGGQGHHGMNINDGTTLTGYMPSTTFNALIRPAGDMLTPVELMNFTLTND